MNVCIHTSVFDDDDDNLNEVDVQIKDIVSLSRNRLTNTPRRVSIREVVRITDSNPIHLD